MASNETELRVLRLRRYLVAGCVVVSEELLQALAQRGLVSGDQLRVIQTQKVARERSIAVVEALLCAGPQFSLQSFCQCLQARYRFLVKQLIGTLRAESGDLLPDGATQREADIIVFKTFGASRRLSERDKRRMANIIATRSLIAQQDQLKQLSGLNQQSRRLSLWYSTMDRQIADLNVKMRAFIKQNQLKQIGTFVDLRSTTDVLFPKSSTGGKGGSRGDGTPSKDEGVQELEDTINFILAKFSRVVAEKECARYNVESLEWKNKSEEEEERQQQQRKQLQQLQHRQQLKAQQPQQHKPQQQQAALEWADRLMEQQKYSLVTSLPKVKFSDDVVKSNQGSAVLI